MLNLSASNLSIGYSRKKKVNLLQSDLNLSLESGELVCLIGHNGCGKSTLLRTLAGLQTALKGEIKIGNKNIDLLTQREKALLISIVLTERVEIENTTVFNLVALGRHPHGRWWKDLSTEDRSIILKSIDLVHLKEKADCPINELSDGERQRAMIAKDLAQDTPIILLDEPTAHLDLANRVEIMLLLRQLAHKTKKGILLSTHELDLALQAADRIWLMNTEGGIECGVPEDLILSNKFNQTFNNKNYTFNTKNGNFLINYPGNQRIAVEGDAERVYWTCRALTRAAYTIDNQADIKVEVKKNSWIINGKELKTVEDLLNELKPKSEPTNRATP